MLKFDNIDFKEFWNDCEYSEENYHSADYTEELLHDIEAELGYKLPKAYIELMKTHNGGMVNFDCCPCDSPTSWAEDHICISGIMGIGREKEYSLCGELGSQFMIDEWEYPAIGVAICDCPSAGHDMVFLDYRECGKDGEPCVSNRRLSQVISADYFRRKHLSHSAVNDADAHYTGGKPQIIAGLFQCSRGWIEIRPRTDRDLEH